MVLPKAVLGELDGLKRNDNDTTAGAARRASRFLLDHMQSCQRLPEVPLETKTPPSGGGNGGGGDGDGDGRGSGDGCGGTGGEGSEGEGGATYFWCRGESLQEAAMGAARAVHPPGASSVLSAGDDAVLACAAHIKATQEQRAAAVLAAEGTKEGGGGGSAAVVLVTGDRNLSIHAIGEGIEVHYTVGSMLEWMHGRERVKREAVNHSAGAAAIGAAQWAGPPPGHGTNGGGGDTDDDDNLL